MELNQDWRRYQDTFFPVRKIQADEAKPIYVIEDQGLVLSVFCEGEDLSAWRGSTIVELRAQFTNRFVTSVSRARMDQWTHEALGEAHLPGQLSMIRGKWIASVAADAGSQKVSQKVLKATEELSQRLPGRGHFLLDAIEGSWWTRVLPSSFGLLIRLERDKDTVQDFLMVYRRGKLEQFGEPDLSYLAADRRQQLSEVCRTLSERTSLAIQSLVVSEQDWRTWSEQAHPWKEIAWALQSKRAQIVPYPWPLVALVATRGFVGI